METGAMLSAAQAAAGMERVAAWVKKKENGAGDSVGEGERGRQPQGGRRRECDGGKGVSTSF